MDDLKRLCVLFKNNDIDNITTICKKNGNEKIVTWFYFMAVNAIKKEKGDVELCKKVVKIIEEIYYLNFIGTVTLTYGEVAESHVGMEKIGHMAAEGFKHSDILRAKKFFEERGCDVEIIHLNTFLPERERVTYEERRQLDIAYDNEDFQAYVFVARNGLKCLVDDDGGKNTLTECLVFSWDTKLYNERRKIVQNKNARYNLNFDDVGQEADFEKGKGTTISWDKTPFIYTIKNKLVDAFGEKASELKCEGNKYYEITKKAGIGPHGDTERKKVIGVRLGKSMNIFWNWYYNDIPRGKAMSIILNPGDVYCMTEKTVGTDWRPNLSLGYGKKRYTLRHSAGAPQYTTNTPKRRLSNPRTDNNVTVWDIEYKTVVDGNKIWKKVPY